MVLPLLAAAIGAGGTIAGGLIGAGAQEDANQMNWAINLMNYYQRERERRDRIRDAESTRRDQKLGATDAQGNRTKFVEGKGWVTELTDQNKLINQLQQQEQQQVLQNDLPLRRRQMMRNDARQQDEGFVADALLERFRTEAEVDPEALRRTMVGAATSAINRQYDDLTNTAAREAIRSGSSNTGRIFADLARDRMKNIVAAVSGIPLQAKQMASDMTAKNRNGLLQQYGALAGRASQMPGVSYRPENVQGNADNLMKYFSGQAQQGNSLANAAYGQAGGTLDYVRPNTGYGDALASGASVLASGINKFDAYNDRQKAMGRDTTGW